MHARNMMRTPALPLLLLAVCLVQGCGSHEINTTWVPNRITIDGTPTDWRGIPITYVEAPNIAIRAINDSSHLYICLSSPDRNVARQIAICGLTIWFDADGGKDKELGIHFPLGTRDFSSLAAGMAGRRPDRDRSRDMTGGLFEGTAEKVEILGSEDSGVLASGDPGSLGIDAAIGNPGGKYVYELKVPLHQSTDHPYAINPKLDKPIGIGLETGQIDREAMMEAFRKTTGEGREGMPPGGKGERPAGGGPGGGPPGGGMGRGSGGGSMPARLEFWALAVLATPDDATPTRSTGQ